MAQKQHGEQENSRDDAANNHHALLHRFHIVNIVTTHAQGQIARYPSWLCGTVGICNGFFVCSADEAIFNFFQMAEQQQICSVWQHAKHLVWKKNEGWINYKKYLEISMMNQISHTPKPEISLKNEKSCTLNSLIMYNPINYSWPKIQRMSHCWVENRKPSRHWIKACETCTYTCELVNYVCKNITIRDTFRPS